jgi:hypothetical protein
MHKQSGLGAIIAIAALLSGHCAANAAIVSPESGPVLINDGNGFVPISGDTALRPGARVMAKKGGTAVIHYGDSCTVRVEPGQVLMIQEKAPCEGASADGLDTTTLAVGGAALAGVGIAIAVTQGGDDKPASP